MDRNIQQNTFWLNHKYFVRVGHSRDQRDKKDSHLRRPLIQMDHRYPLGIIRLVKLMMYLYLQIMQLPRGNSNQQDIQKAWTFLLLNSPYRQDNKGKTIDLRLADMFQEDMLTIQALLGHNIYLLHRIHLLH